MAVAYVRAVLRGNARDPHSLKTCVSPSDLPDKACFDVQELLSAARVLGYEHPDIAALFQVFSEMVTAPAVRERGFRAA
jgi:hypothetical protein